MKTCIASLILAAMCFAAGEGSEPKHPEARGAVAEYEQQLRYAAAQRESALEKAQKDFELAVSGARRDYVLRLRKALAAALKGQDLDDANRINAKIKQAEEEAKTGSVPGADEGKKVPAGNETKPVEKKDDPQVAKLRGILVSKKWELGGAPAKFILFNADGSAQTATHGDLKWNVQNDGAVVVWQPSDHVALFRFDPKTETFSGRFFLSAKATLK
ncbi:MAG: hypothetical protein WD768_16600 [Phycisphaeraceae bacterium]